mmetsp:Transcript_2262/g.8353  ORF Transcript_2262/g.8353 Transcript_2262/m.8353 type:complete len:97 (+) Transcript_2262:7860-8150(+)
MRKFCSENYFCEAVVFFVQKFIVFSRHSLAPKYLTVFSCFLLFRMIRQHHVETRIMTIPITYMPPPADVTAISGMPNLRPLSSQPRMYDFSPIAYL